MALNKKNLRYCEVLYNGNYYDVMIAVDDLDEVNNILQEWALDKFGSTLDLPEALIKNKDATEIITSKDVNNFVYLPSPQSSFMDVPRYAGISGTSPTFPTALVGGNYQCPATTAFLYSEPLFAGFFGEYSVAALDLPLTDGMNYIAIDYNSGEPIWTILSDRTYNFSSVIPVLAILKFSTSIYVIPIGQTGYGLPEKLLEVIERRRNYEIIDPFTLTTNVNYVVLSELIVSNGVNETTTEAIDTAFVDNDMYLYYRDNSSVWQTTKIAQIDNLQYQSASGLTTLGAGEFVVNSIYRVIDGSKQLLFVKLSNKFADVSSAKESAAETDLPDEIKESSILVGRIIVEQGSATPQIQRVQKTSFGV